MDLHPVNLYGNCSLIEIKLKPTEPINQQKYQSHPKGIFNFSIFILTV